MQSIHICTYVCTYTHTCTRTHTTLSQKDVDGHSHGILDHLLTIIHVTHIHTYIYIYSIAYALIYKNICRYIKRVQRYLIKAEPYWNDITVFTVANSRVGNMNGLQCFLKCVFPLNFSDLASSFAYAVLLFITLFLSGK